jgi:nucleoside-diphosphate-sugar epimerase
MMGVEPSTALVTGAAGFLGRQLCALLREDGIRVRAVDRMAAAGPWDEYIRADLTEAASFAGLCDGADTVFHLAAKTHAVGSSARDLADYQALNVDLTGRLLQEATTASVRRFLFTSSVKVFGEGQHEPQSETYPPCPESVYGQTKWEAEQLVNTAGTDADLETTILRMPLIYGPGVKGNLENMLTALAKRRFPALPETGNRRSLVDVRDVVAALKLCAEHSAAAGRTYVVTDGKVYSTHEMAALMRHALGRGQPRCSIPDGVFRGAASAGQWLGALGLPVVFDREVYQKLLGSACYSSRAIETDLGFEPRYDLAASLPDMVERLQRPA